MSVFVAAVFLLLITPGPGVLSTAGVGAAFGAGAGYRYVTGLFVGTNLVALAVVTGLAGIVLGEPRLRAVLLYASVLYLGWLAFRIGTRGSTLRVVRAESAPGFRAAIMLQAINPKAYVVNTALFTGFPFVGWAGTSEVIAKFIVINAIWIPIHLLWLAAGIAIERLELPPSRQRLVNIAMALALLTVVALALFVGERQG